jgi:L-fuconolactonase
MLTIDAHQHFWNYTPGEYGWIDSSMQVLRRDYLPEHLKLEIDQSGVTGVVAVQARESVEETRWLLELASANSFIRAVVGWAPLTEPDVADVIHPLLALGPLRGLRHVLQGEADDRYMLRDDFNRGVSTLRGFDLAYDILILERHLPHAIEFVDLHPDQVFIVDHIAKPRIRDSVISPWREHIRSLAQRPNVYCKLSGMVTEASWSTWTEKQLEPYFDTVLDAFGPGRLMFGSDWPVCLLATSYGAWFETVSKWIVSLTECERNDILGGTAARAYRISRKVETAL